GGGRGGGGGGGGGGRGGGAGGGGGGRDVERLHAELVGGDVDHALAGEHLGRPRAAVGDVGRLVGDHRLGAETDSPDLEGPRQHLLDEAGDHPAHARIGTGVDGHVDIDGQEIALRRIGQRRFHGLF